MLRRIQSGRHLIFCRSPSSKRSRLAGMTAKAILVASTGSGTGKTTLTAGLLRALRRRGLERARRQVRPRLHRSPLSSSRERRGIDQPRQLGDAAAASRRVGGDTPRPRRISSSSKAPWASSTGVREPPGGPARRPISPPATAIPVVLVLDVTGQSQTAAAVVRGLASHDAAVRIAGVVLNRVASERHRTLVADAIGLTEVPVLGAIPRDAAIALPSRHLGLVQATRARRCRDAAGRPRRHGRAARRPRPAARSVRTLAGARRGRWRRAAAAAGKSNRAR